MLPPRDPRGRRRRAAQRLARASAAGARSATVTRPLARRRASSSCATARCEVQHRPGHSPSDTLFWDAERADPDRRRPPDRAHLLQPADLPPARRLRRDARPQAAGHLHASRCAQTRELPAEIVLSGHGEPITDHVALIDERFAMHRAPRREDPRADRRAAAHRLRARPGDLGQRRRHPGLPDPLRGDRPRRPADRRRAACARSPTATASCASRACGTRSRRRARRPVVDAPRRASQVKLAARSGPAAASCGHRTPAHASVMARGLGSASARPRRRSPAGRSIGATTRSRSPSPRCRQAEALVGREDERRRAGVEPGSSASSTWPRNRTPRVRHVTKLRAVAARGDELDAVVGEFAVTASAPRFLRASCSRRSARRAG